MHFELDKDAVSWKIFDHPIFRFAPINEQVETAVAVVVVVVVVVEVVVEVDVVAFNAVIVLFISYTRNPRIF